MTLSTGSTVYDSSGSSFRLGRHIASGGQGSVWELDGHKDKVAKFYHNGFTDTDFAKVSAMCRLKTEAISGISAWPLSLLGSTKSGKPSGLLMRRVADCQAIHQLYGMKSRLRTFPTAQLPFLVHVATNVSRAFATIHGAGQVIGDVNHSNLMVSTNGTVILIDCDSFQISDGQRTFRCPVGVPEFTPPELQGRNFSEQTRTPQHDAFGLSVLIFYLLFLGRHPFMGVYDRKSDEIVSLDQAISQYKFPYALGTGSQEVKLPSFVPRLSDYPADLGRMFIRAFTNEAKTVGRPSANEWVGGLETLSKRLGKCEANPNHHYIEGLGGCPWCRAEGVLGRPIFGVRISVLSSSGFAIATVWAEIASIRATPEPLDRPDIDTVKSKYIPDSTVAEIAKKRRLLRLCSIALALVASVIAVGTLVPLAAIATIVISLVLAGRIWKRASRDAVPIIETYNEALKTYKSAESEFDALLDIPKAYSEARSLLEMYKKEYEQLPTEKARKLAELNAQREAKQRHRFLETFRIEDANLPNIGPKNKVILRTFGIEDASDVDAARISGIKGFGPVKIQILLDWRRSKEILFRFDPRQPIDPRDLSALEQGFAQKTQALETTLKQGPSTLRQSISVWQSQRRRQAAALSHLAESLAKAEVNRKALGVF